MSTVITMFEPRGIGFVGLNVTPAMEKAESLFGTSSERVNAANARRAKYDRRSGRITCVFISPEPFYETVLTTSISPVLKEIILRTANASRLRFYTPTCSTTMCVPPHTTSLKTELPEENSFPLAIAPGPP
jgi:hypothetical protein